MTFTHAITTRGTETFVEMNGHLDERATMPDVTRLGAGPLTLDLGGVSLINSLGCRRWITWIADVAARVERVDLARCSSGVVQQINLLGGFTPKGVTVTSLFVPYECPRCGHAARVLHQIAGGFDVNTVPESLICTACGTAMNLEIMRQTYFKFLTDVGA